MPIASDPTALARLRRARPLAVAAAGFGVITALVGCAAEPSTGGSGGAGGSSSDDTADTSAAYADGTYDAEGSYQSPGGTESVGVELTLEGDVVTAVTVTPQAEGGNAVKFQEQFASGIADEVVGKDIDTLNVTRVAGSSLTSGGFNDALDQIKADAAA